ncbi:MAG: sugar ABC transporter permease [Candidatus Hydrogenedentes bacterium]|nr:sugar ABC transporter permease [Candidatus Hydrogenedentota bacterium]
MLRGRSARSEALHGILFASPWLLGFCIFTAFPIGWSILLSLSDWDPYDPVVHRTFVGLANYKDVLTSDPLVLKALLNTFTYALMVVPLGMSVSLGLAILLNQKVRGISFFRTAFYVPSVVGGVATTILWTYILNPVFGPLNNGLHAINVLLDKSIVLSFIRLPEPLWLFDPAWTKPSLVLMAMWGAGGAGMLIFLAGLQGVPGHLYEVADLDGAGKLRKFWNITLPMLSPTIYFNLVMGLIGSLQVFMQAYVIDGGKGGMDNSLLFYVLYIYRKAFVEYEMGYAAAMAWVLFTIILCLTLLVIKSSAIWVYYEGEKNA